MNLSGSSLMKFRPKQRITAKRFVNPTRRHEWLACPTEQSRSRRSADHAWKRPTRQPAVTPGVCTGREPVYNVEGVQAGTGPYRL